MGWEGRRAGCRDGMRWNRLEVTRRTNERWDAAGDGKREDVR